MPTPDSRKSALLINLLLTLILTMIAVNETHAQVSTCTPASAAWTAESNQTRALLGSSVSGAGDVNGDGFADVIVGAHGYTGDQNREGAAFLWYGSANGLGPNGTPVNADWTGEGNQAGTNVDGNVMYGISVASAGDVNGDGFDDVIIGAPMYNSRARDDGRVAVYYGSTEGLPTTPSWTAIGLPVSKALFGYAVASAGDINGDGFGDIIVGAPGMCNPLDTNCFPPSGMVFVWFGGPGGLGAEGTPENADWSAVSVHLPGADDEFGISVAGLGDVNGDGFGDVIVGAQFYSRQEMWEGAAFVWLGGGAGLGDLGTPANADWSATGNWPGALTGTSVASAGDVDGDGFADVIIGAPGMDNGQLNEGTVYVWLGGSGGLGDPGNPDNAYWRAQANQEEAWFGWSAGSVGDMNGDGYSDVFAGAPSFDAGQENEGKVFVWFGGPRINPLTIFGGPRATPVTALGEWGSPQNADWCSESDLTAGYWEFGFGVSAASAGDINRDGAADLIVGQYNVQNLERSEGRAYLFLSTPPFTYKIPKGPLLDWNQFHPCFQIPVWPDLPGMDRIPTSKDVCPPLPTCPQCVRSLSWTRNIDPIERTRVLNLWRSIEPVLRTQADSSPSLQRLLQDLEKVGPISLELAALRDSTLAGLRAIRRSQRVTPEQSTKLIQLLNAVDLSARAPSPLRAAVPSGQRTAVDLNGVALLSFAEVATSGDVELDIIPSVPTLVPGFNPSWPVAEYRFNFHGKLKDGGSVTISLKLDGFQFTENTDEVRILEWNGQEYRDVTVAVDRENRIITAKTNRLASYVLMSKADGAKAK